MRCPPVIYALCSIAIAVSLKPERADAQVQCGDTITEDAVLDRDLSCLDGLMLVGPATLDFNEHFVTCDCAPTIIVTGRRARLHSGVVFSLVTLAGDGSHLVRDVRIDGRGIGLSIVSSRNVIVHNRIGGFFFPAVEVLAERNVIRDNSISTSAQDGLWVSFPRNRIIGSMISTLAGNALTLYGLGDRTHVMDNIILGGDTPFSNGVGIEVSTDHNLIMANEVSAYVEGIKLKQGAKKNKVNRNIAIDNLEFDLVDNNPDCEKNIWAKNQFDTANQACIFRRGRDVVSGKSPIRRPDPTTLAELFAAVAPVDVGHELDQFDATLRSSRSILGEQARRAPE